MFLNLEVAPESQLEVSVFIDREGPIASILLA